MKCGPPPLLLPEIVADSCEELATMAGTTKNSIMSYICHHKKGEITNSERYVAVLVDEED